MNYYQFNRIWSVCIWGFPFLFLGLLCWDHTLFIGPPIVTPQDAEIARQNQETIREFFMPIIIIPALVVMPWALFSGLLSLQDYAEQRWSEKQRMRITNKMLPILIPATILLALLTLAVITGLLG